MAPLRLGLIAGAASIAVTLVSFGAGSPAVPSTSTAGAVKSTNPMLDPRSGHSATLLGNDDVLIAGGADHDAPGGIALAEVFHSASQTFEAVGSMHYRRISHTATLINDGRVLVAGGRGDGVVGISELYDPKTRKFEETGSLLSARYKHTAGLLPDGRVLIAGGSDDRDWNGTMSTAEIYDLRTGKFTATSPMADSRFKLPYEAPRLASGKRLIAGGSKHAEIYDAQT